MSKSKETEDLPEQGEERSGRDGGAGAVDAGPAPSIAELLRANKKEAAPSAVAAGQAGRGTPPVILVQTPEGGEMVARSAVAGGGHDAGPAPRQPSLAPSGPLKGTAMAGSGEGGANSAGSANSAGGANSPGSANSAGSMKDSAGNGSKQDAAGDVPAHDAGKSNRKPDQNNGGG